MNDAQKIAIAGVLFAFWVMFTVWMHLRAKDGSAQRRDAHAARPVGRQPGPAGRAQGVLPDPHAGERDE